MGCGISSLSEVYFVGPPEPDDGAAAERRKGSAGFRDWPVEPQPAPSRSEVLREDAGGGE